MSSHSMSLLPSVLWYCWLGLLTCKNRLLYNLYCVGGDVKHCTIQSSHFYRRDAMLARVIVIATCLSVCPSVTRRYCVKTKKASVMISSPSGSPKTLVFWRQISSPNSKGFPPNGASNKGRSEKFSDFLALSVNISKTVADTAKVTISD